MFNFETALKLVKKGYSARRKDWSGYIAKMPKDGFMLPSYEELKNNPFGIYKINCYKYVGINKVLEGVDYTASSEDLMANDWVSNSYGEVIEEDL